MTSYLRGGAEPVLGLTALSLARRFIGVREVPGSASNPHVLAMLQLDAKWPKGDQTPWCSAFVNYVAWLLDLPRSGNLRARSWLAVGHSVGLAGAREGFDVVVLSRGTGRQPGTGNLTAPGHVGFYAGRRGPDILVLGGNQKNRVSVQAYPLRRLLSVRRLLG